MSLTPPEASKEFEPIVVAQLGPGSTIRVVTASSSVYTLTVEPRSKSLRGYEKSADGRFKKYIGEATVDRISRGDRLLFIRSSDSGEEAYQMMSTVETSPIQTAEVIDKTPVQHVEDTRVDVVETLNKPPSRPWWQRIFR